VPLERMADPTDTNYIPRPEWYFLFLFQILKVFNGPLEVIGTVLLPTVAILALILTPFIDRSRMVKLRQRTLAFGIVVLAALGWGGLTGAAVATTGEQTAAEQIDFSGPTQWMQLTPVQMAGIHYFRDAQCSMCHNVTGDTPKPGPNLLNAGRRHDAAWLAMHFANPAAASPNTTMKPTELNDTGIKSLTALMVALTPENGDVVDSAPDFAVEGALIYQKNGCAACHMLNGAGSKAGPGPELNGVANRRSEAWVIQHFQNPQMMSPKTPMPPYKFNATDMQNEVSYLFTLPSKAPGQ
jgi:cbb3-type cytochrome oxidase cytochrome c subunit